MNKYSIITAKRISNGASGRDIFTKHGRPSSVWRDVLDHYGVKFSNEK